MWFCGISGVGAKIFGGNPLGMQRPRIYAFSGIVGPDLTRRAVAYYIDKPIAICQRRKFPRSHPLRDFLPISRYISQTIQNIAIVTVEGE